MASTSETGHYKNIANFNLLREHCITIGADYNPSNTTIQLPGLLLAYTTVFNQHQAVNTAKQPFIDAVNQREIAFIDMAKLATRTFNALAASANIQPNILDDARTILRKIRGKRASKTIPESEIQISVSQRSYDNLYDHFSEFVALVSAVPTYTPNEPQLQTMQLQAFAANLLAKNNAFNQTSTLYTKARITRNTDLYHPQNGLVALAGAVKAYIKSAFGGNSSAYQTVGAIKFTKQKI